MPKRHVYVVLSIFAFATLTVLLIPKNGLGIRSETSLRRIEYIRTFGGTLSRVLCSGCITEQDRITLDLEKGSLTCGERFDLKLENVAAGDLRKLIRTYQPWNYRPSFWPRRKLAWLSCLIATKFGHKVCSDSETLQLEYADGADKWGDWQSWGPVEEFADKFEKKAKTICAESVVLGTVHPDVHDSDYWAATAVLFLKPELYPDEKTNLYRNYRDYRGNKYKDTLLPVGFLPLGHFKSVFWMRITSCNSFGGSKSRLQIATVSDKENIYTYVFNAEGQNLCEDKPCLESRFSNPHCTKDGIDIELGPKVTKAFAWDGKALTEKTGKE